MKVKYIGIMSLEVGIYYNLVTNISIKQVPEEIAAQEHKRYMDSGLMVFGPVYKFSEMKAVLNRHLGDYIFNLKALKTSLTEITQESTAYEVSKNI